MWQWLKNPDNRTVLSWLGSGLVVLAGGLIAWHLRASAAHWLQGAIFLVSLAIFDANQGNVVCGDVASGRDTVIGGPQPTPNATGN